MKHAQFAPHEWHLAIVTAQATPSSSRNLSPRKRRAGIQAARIEGRARRGGCPHRQAGHPVGRTMLSDSIAGANWYDRIAATAS